MQRKYLIFFSLVAGIIVGGYLYHVGSNSDAVTVKYSETTPWIEVYRGNVLSSEWQPSDGEIYRFLKKLLEGDMVKKQNPPYRLRYRGKIA